MAPEMGPFFCGDQILSEKLSSRTRPVSPDGRETVRDIEVGICAHRLFRRLKSLVTVREQESRARQFWKPQLPSGNLFKCCFNQFRFLRLRWKCAHSCS